MTLYVLTEVKKNKVWNRVYFSKKKARSSFQLMYLMKTNKTYATMDQDDIDTVNFMNYEEPGYKLCVDGRQLVL
jgi:hypothetical protein